MLKSLSIAAWLAVAGVTFGACATAPKSSAGKAEIRQEASLAVSKARDQDSGLAEILDSAHAYAVFPKVGKGGAGVGGAYGKGVVFQNGRAIGYCDLSQATIGLQLGGQTYTEIVCFEDQRALQRFKDGGMAFDAQATAVALESGAGANASYRNGVAVFTSDEKGLMVEAAVGGQKFTYQGI
jgi:lipid-binding SYLF domain-containing protein